MSKEIQISQLCIYSRGSNLGLKMGRRITCFSESPLGQWMCKVCAKQRFFFDYLRNCCWLEMFLLHNMFCQTAQFALHWHVCLIDMWLTDKSVMDVCAFDCPQNGVWIYQGLFSSITWTVSTTCYQKKKPACGLYCTTAETITLWIRARQLEKMASLITDWSLTSFIR